MDRVAKKARFDLITGGGGGGGGANSASAFAVHAMREKVFMRLVRSPAEAVPTASTVWTNPDFTDTIFKNDKVFGYKGLRIELSFHAVTFKCHLNITYTEKITTMKADDLVAVFKENLLGGFTQSIEEFQSWVTPESFKFRPKGETAAEYQYENFELAFFFLFYFMPNFSSCHSPFGFSTLHIFTTPSK